MLDRRKFLLSSLLSTGAMLLRKTSVAAKGSVSFGEGPLVISTWAPNVKANEAAWKLLEEGGSALDAVEQGVQVTEADPTDQSVGYGGLPDRDGKVTLDACIMDGRGNCGSVMFLETIKHPVRLARLVMDKTPHVQLAGEGALQFALANGFVREELLTPEAEKAWRNWLKQSNYDPMTIPKLLEQRSLPGQQDNHDTIGMIAVDAAGRLAGACSTSGMAFKMRGRVGDSPIIGAGLFVDEEAGAATASGVGEELVRICGSHTVVEYMRQGLAPGEACKRTIERLVRKRGEEAAARLQVGFIAVNTRGEYGAYSLQKGFSAAVRTRAGAKTFDSPYFFG
ncbi:MAG TPA: N(4)-(beta-N-acetylglucosaminyl)-L-asparaginase [Flavisolibacter sp.]|nr:N(4)-(beta-N-acetylglucosaminyl)-L-asparaginase [Flavisolibacter sp.]